MVIDSASRGAAVAKSEGHFKDVGDYEPNLRVTEIIQTLGKDPMFVQAVMEESSEILLTRPSLLV